MSDTTAHELARAVLRAYFDGAAFRRVPARCILAAERVLMHEHMRELREIAEQASRTKPTGVRVRKVCGLGNGTADLPHTVYEPIYDESRTNEHGTKGP